MTNEKVLSVVDAYAARLDADGFEPVRLEISDAIDASDVGAALHHVRWMCDEIKKFLADNRSEKAARWFGFIQGTLWLAGYYTIEELMFQNKPPEEPSKPAA